MWRRNVETVVIAACRAVQPSVSVLERHPARALAEQAGLQQVCRPPGNAHTQRGRVAEGRLETPHCAREAAPPPLGGPAGAPGRAGRALRGRPGAGKGPFRAGAEDARSVCEERQQRGGARRTVCACAASAICRLCVLRPGGPAGPRAGRGDVRFSL